MIRFVIFDVDGTLVDSVDLHARAWQETLEEFGHHVSFQEVRAQIGKGGDQLLPVFLSEEALAREEKKISERRAAHFRENFLPKVRAFRKVRDLFVRLRKDGKRIALASSAAAEELEAYKQRADITDLVEEETSKDDAERSKPHPDIFVAALERFGNPPKGETIVIGDTPYDIEAARKAGLRTIAVRSGGFPEETLQGAIAIYNDPSDLLANYGSSLLSGGAAANGN